MSYPRSYVRSCLQFKLPNQWRRRDYLKRKRNWARLYDYLSPADLYDISQEGLREQDREEQERFDKEKAEREDFVAKQKAEMDAKRARASAAQERKRASLKRELNMLKSEGTKITTKEEEEEENATIQETVKAAHENEQDAKENFMEFENYDEPINLMMPNRYRAMEALNANEAKSSTIYVNSGNWMHSGREVQTSVSYVAQTTSVEQIVPPFGALLKAALLEGGEGAKLNQRGFLQGRIDKTKIAMKLSKLTESNDSPDYVQATWPKAKMESSNTRGIERPPAIPGPYKTEVMGHTTVRTPKTKKIIGGKPRQMKKEKPQELQPLTQIVPTIAKKYVRKLKICRKGLQPTASVSSGESSPEYFVKKNNSATGTRKFMRRVRYIIDKEFSNMPGTTYRCPKMHLQGHKFVGRHRTKIWLCLVCQKEERDEKGDVMVCCEKCEDWYHLRCVGVANEKVPKYINWYCKRCIVRHCREGDFDKSAFPLYQKPGSKLKAALKLKV